MNPEGFDLLYTAADQLAMYVVDALRQQTIEPGIHEGKLQSHIVSH